MPSAESRAQAAHFATIAARFPADRDPFLTRALYNTVSGLASEVLDASYEDISIPTCDRPALWINTPHAPSYRVVLFFHGGGFHFGSPLGHRKLAAHLAGASDVSVLSLDYRMAPEARFPAASDDAIAAYEWLLAQGYKGESIALAGDGCGANLGTATCLLARQKGLEMPAAVVSLSPWYDLANTGESLQTNGDTDALSDPRSIQALSDGYLKGHDPRDPIASPLYAADLGSLPPHWISVGTHDMLMDDGTRFAEKAMRQGAEIITREYEGQQHVVEFMSGKAPEADESIREIGLWLKMKLR